MSTSTKEQKFKFVRQVGTNETSNDDVRVARYSVPVGFAAIQQRVAELYNLDTNDFVLKYLDSENELIVLADDDDIHEAIIDHAFVKPPQVASIRVHVLKKTPVASPTAPPLPPSADNIPPLAPPRHLSHARKTHCGHESGAPPHSHMHRRYGSGGRGNGRGRRWGWGITQLENHCQRHQQLMQQQQQQQQQQGYERPRVWRQGGLHSVVKPLMGQLRTILSKCEDNTNMVIKVGVHPSCENAGTTASVNFEVPVPKETIMRFKNKKTSGFRNAPGSTYGSVRGALMEEIRAGRRVPMRVCFLQEIRTGHMLKKRSVNNTPAPNSSINAPSPPPTVPEQVRSVARDAAKEALARKEDKERRMQARAQERQEKKEQRIQARAQERQDKQQALEERRKALIQGRNAARAAAKEARMQLKRNIADKDKDTVASNGLALFEEQVGQVSVAVDSDDGFVKVAANDESNVAPPLPAPLPQEGQAKDSTASTIMETKVELLNQMGLDLGEGTQRLIEAMGGHIDLIITALIKNKKLYQE